MPRVPAHTLDDAPEQTRPTLETLSKRMGKLLNIHGGMAHSPVVLATYTAMQEAIASHGTFDGKTREAIALAVGAADNCDYCQSAHTLGGKAAGLEADTMLAVRAGRPTGDDRLAVVREATLDVGAVQDDTWKQAQAAGWSDEELTEAFAHLAANLYTNYFNHYIGTELDVPAAPAV
jgi:AhpD family alkylhydroperoxidase